MLRPLHTYEPLQGLSRFTELDGQLVLDLLPLRDSLALTAPGPGGKLTPAYVRAVLTAVLEVRTGLRPLVQLRGLVHPRLLRQLTVSTRIRGARFTLNRVRISPLGPSAYEASGIAVAESRGYGVMARFELTEPGWRCTYVDLVLPSKNRA
ncbi:hypothetical protein FPZ12_012095 [Amycolatopsis acidicola]|uniref:Uncharacterized protein n=1 Tax=Amycolatopsis acidicola TaxID=2596893 RepID=A0A5N0V7H4_9PSEU|nr:Rv3235 family protein [Amycolatopsis acidicola]KAA9162366.1 hypothetical protein FPZ12_012095 [Amycolatopsis acidicola]